jgi:hypothetical protein
MCHGMIGFGWIKLSPNIIKGLVDPLAIRLGLEFDHAGINSAMTHIMLLSAKVRRNERFI